MSRLYLNLLVDGKTGREYYVPTRAHSAQASYDRLNQILQLLNEGQFGYSSRLVAGYKAQLDLPVPRHEPPPSPYPGVPPIPPGREWPPWKTPSKGPKRGPAIPEITIIIPNIDDPGKDIPVN